MYTRANMDTIDVLTGADTELTHQFAQIAPSTGKFQSDTAVSTAHVLNERPLLIGTVTSGSSGSFQPRTPGLYGTEARCSEIGRQEDYAVFRCEDIPTFHLKASYPSLHVRPHHFIGYSAASEQKVLGTEATEDSHSGGIYADGCEFRSVVYKGTVIDVDELYPVYERAVWPIVDLYSKRGRQYLLTYFRQYEANHRLPHAGREGTRWRVVDGVGPYWTKVRGAIIRAAAWLNPWKSTN